MPGGRRGASVFHEVLPFAFYVRKMLPPWRPSNPCFAEAAAFGRIPRETRHMREIVPDWLSRLFLVAILSSPAFGQSYNISTAVGAGVPSNVPGKSTSLGVGIPGLARHHHDGGR